MKAKQTGAEVSVEQAQLWAEEIGGAVSRLDDLPALEVIFSTV